MSDPAARVIEVIEVVFLRGKGVSPDPVRQVIAYYALDGTLLAERDEHEEAARLEPIPHFNLQTLEGSVPAD